MIVRYRSDLSKQTFLESVGILEQAGIFLKDTSSNPRKLLQLGSIDEPVAAFDGPGISQLHDGQLIAALFHHDTLPLGTEYDGTINYWFKAANTWPASIDTLVHLSGQRKAEVLSGAERVLDLGCGTGMAGTYALNKNPKIKQLDFCDINPHAVESVGHNLGEDNNSNGFVGDCFENVKEKYDVIIASAIPATPSYPGLQRPINPLFEGTGFLESFLRNAPSHLNNGGKIILSHSSVGEPAFKDLAKKYGAKVDKVLAERENAFRIEFLDDPKWVQYLVQNGGMVPRNERGYTHWHKELVKQVSY